MINSRRKGAAAERAFRDELRDAGYEDAIRGCQHSAIGADGGAAPDVKCDSLNRFHIEVKHRERGCTRDGYNQAKRDASEEQIPTFAFRKNYTEWLVCVSLKDFFKMVREMPKEFQKL
jgi:hypothetical protein